MTKHRSHSAAFKRQVAEEFIAGETLHGLSQRHDISRQAARKAKIAAGNTAAEAKPGARAKPSRRPLSSAPHAKPARQPFVG